VMENPSVIFIQNSVIFIQGFELFLFRGSNYFYSGVRIIIFLHVFYFRVLPVNPARPSIRAGIGTAAILYFSIEQYIYKCQNNKHTRIGSAAFKNTTNNRARASACNLWVTRENTHTQTAQ